MRFQFMDGVSQEDTVVLPSHMQKLFNKHSGKVVFQFGSMKRSVDIIFSDELSLNRIGVPKELMKPYTVSEEIDFKYKVKENTLTIGPIIAFVFFNKKETLTKKRLNQHLKYAEKYEETGGLFILSTLDSINIVDKSIKGYFYNPNGAKQWEYGTFPYPEVVFRRSNARVKEMADLSKETNGKVFNYPILDKWELYQNLAKYPDIKGHLPETIKSNEIENLNVMLKKHGSVYLKPAKGSLARGIFKVQGRKGSYLIKSNKYGKMLKSYKEMRQFLKSLKRTYLIQQSVMEQLNIDRNIVYRVILQKNGEKKWECNGMYARIGLEGSIVTNRHLTENFLKVEKAFIRHYGLSPEQARDLKEEMIKVCKQFCNALDQLHGHYGDIGFDVMVGNDLRIWIIEANNRAHNHKSPLKTIKDEEMYNQVVMTPLEYAAALANY